MPLQKRHAPSPDGAPSLASGACGCSKAGLPLRTAFGLTHFENRVLDIMRCICDLYASGSSQSWDAALELCEREFGPWDGPVFAARVAALVRAMRVERKPGFGFLAPGCRHISDDELAAISVVRVARGDGAGNVQRAAEALASSTSVDRITIAAQALSSFETQYGSAGHFGGSETVLSAGPHDRPASRKLH